MSRCRLPTWTLPCVVVGVVVFFVSPGSALAADAVTLHVDPNPINYGGRVSLAGAITPAVAGETVGVYTQAGRRWSLVGNATTDALGRFSLPMTAKAHRVFLARAVDAAGNVIE